MFCDIKDRIDEPSVRHIISAAVFDSSEEGLNKWAEKIKSRESRQLYAWIEDNAIIGVCDFEAHADFIEILTIAVEFYRKRCFEITEIRKYNVRRWTCVLPIYRCPSTSSNANCHLRR